MASNNPVPCGMIQYTGLFDFDTLYLAVVDWAKAHRYKLDEDTYKHKVPSPKGAEQEMWLRLEKEISEIYMFKISIDFHLWDMTEVEVIKDGRKKTLTNARLQVKISGNLVVDWQNRFEKNKFTLALRNFLETYVWKRKITSVWGDTLYYRMWNLHSMIKKQLDMQSAWHEYAGYLKENV
ncbi:hypothetical protein ACFLZB_04190 [Nanoarchaeota archaeon]